ncbi:MAG TPA: hypothetical protein VGA52_05560 [Anaerolineales bacterium]|jgi:hypothetical protein
MRTLPQIHPIALYMIEKHPLSFDDDRFEWISSDGLFKEQLEGLIGPYDPAQVSLLVDAEPAGPSWQRLLQAVLDGQIQMVVTHLAPLSPAQRQQLIGVCAQAGAQLITPGDAGRQRNGK